MGWDYSDPYKQTTSTMSEIRVSLAYGNIESREDVDTLERQLKALGNMEVHGLGLSTTEVTYDQNEVSEQDLEQAVQQAGGTLQTIKRIE